jgi:hypothetical protein
MTRKSQISVVGTYRLEITKELVNAQFLNLYPYELDEKHRRIARKRTQDQLKSVALIETLIKFPDDRFSVSHFTQKNDALPKASWQAAYLEKFMDADGLQVLECEPFEIPKRDIFRCVFYLNFYQPAQPLITSYGERFCPAIEDIPDRLKNLVPFEPND